jgi:hypothetical protein
LTGAGPERKKEGLGTNPSVTVSVYGEKRLHEDGRIKRIMR